MAAVGAFLYNRNPDRQVVLPLLDRISPDPYTQGSITVGVLLVLGGLSLLLAVVGVWRERSDQS